MRAPFEGQINGMLAACAHLERPRISRVRGEDSAARAHYERFQARYDLAGPAHRHLVEEARAALAR